MKKKVMNSKAQIWVETVIYTLIAFAMIGLALAFIKPKIDEIRDNSVIEQSINMLEEINGIITELSLKDPGNQRIVDIGITKGELTINASNNSLIFELTGESAYSEPGESIETGNVIIHTEQSGETYLTTLMLVYEDYDLKYNELETAQTLSGGSNPYKVLISRQSDSGGQPVINFEVI